MKIIDEFESYCREYVLPLIIGDVLDGRWRGVVPSFFKEKKSDYKYVLYFDYTSDRELDLSLSLSGFLEDKTLMIYCKCSFLNQAQNEISHLNTDRRIDNIIEKCIKEFTVKGFGISQENESIYVWASLGEPNGQYIVEGIDEPYDLYSKFIDVVFMNL